MSILDLPHGLHADIPDTAYHARVLGFANKSGLDVLHRSPARYKAWCETPHTETDESDALAFGKAFHCALFEQSRFATAYVVEPAFGDCRLKDNKARRDAWRAENAGKRPLSHDDMGTILGMRSVLREHAIIGPLLANGAAELTLRWQDRATGVECKARPDLYVESLGICVDLKTTADARPKAFARSVETFGYHRQRAHYEHGFATIGKPLKHFLFLAQEKEPPFEVAIYELDAASSAVGWNSILQDLNRLAMCLKMKTWPPGLPSGIQPLGLPAWGEGVGEP